MSTGDRRLLVSCAAFLSLTALQLGAAVAEPAINAASAAAPAASTSASDEAKSKLAYQRGAQLYQAKQYDEAIAAFREGYARKPHPAFLFNLAMAYRAKGDPQSAIENYEAYLKAQPDASDRAAVEAAIAEQRTKLAAAAPASAAQPGVTLVKTGDGGIGGSSQPIYRKWWFWTATGVAVAALGVGLGVGLAKPETAPFQEVTWR